MIRIPNLPGYLLCLPIAGLLFLASCASTNPLHEYFGANRYMSDYYLHVYNDSLQLHFYSPADIDYFSDEQELANRVEKEDWIGKQKPLVYGRTDTPPYEVYLFASSEPLEMMANGRYILDTLLNQTHYYFVGKALEESADHAVQADMQTMFNSLEVGTDYRKEVVSVMRVVEKSSNSHTFLAALTRIQQFPVYDERENSLQEQMALTFSSFLGDNEVYRDLLKKYESRFIQDEAVSEIINQRGIKDDVALDTLERLARDVSLVMINENHFYPNHRMLLHELLPRLKRAGYNYLAMEALNPGQDSVLNSAGSFPTVESGFYLREQQFRWLIREAQRLGFTLVAYESRDGSREMGQAENLFNATFAADSSARVIVFAGIDHILEVSGPKYRPRMAELFRKTYGIDPLTISQTRLSHYTPENPGVFTLIASEAFDQPSFQSVDYYLINQKTLGPAYNYEARDFANTYDSDIQVALFYASEIRDIKDIANKTPYFTTIVAQGMSTILPQAVDMSSYLVVYDSFGNDLAVKVIPPAN